MGSTRDCARHGCKITSALVRRRILEIMTREREFEIRRSATLQAREIRVAGMMGKRVKTFGSRRSATAATIWPLTRCSATGGGPKFRAIGFSP
jgi:hypothetical protein